MTDHLMTLATRLHDLTEELPTIFDDGAKLDLDDIDLFTELSEAIDDLWAHVRALQVSADLEQLDTPAWRHLGAKATNRKAHTI